MVKRRLINLRSLGKNVSQSW